MGSPQKQARNELWNNGEST